MRPGHSSNACSSSKCVYHVTSNMPGQESSGEGPGHMTSNMRGQGSKLHDQQYPKGRKTPPGGEVLVVPVLSVAGAQGFPPWWPSEPGPLCLLCSRLTAYHSFISK